MARNWISRLAENLRRAYDTNSFGDRDVDARRVRSELDAIRVRFPDHS
ncbi:hypothetical protein [Mycolicibacterium lutetiense]|jgi:hypothetical protein|uniref:Uncharacterized protein n=1 Tax=Mycolicibacterium lutetiense TaxID=1641992 RepID=A0ABS4ZUU8_9MYCO|nr:hypothetical protein [Mycolicibacterium lutetiense]MBP2453287.1 hypothetical protein [Mycolicibacterium lutetiense]